jgi:hypothetical protein
MSVVVFARDRKLKGLDYMMQRYVIKKVSSWLFTRRTGLQLLSTADNAVSCAVETHHPLSPRTNNRAKEYNWPMIRHPTRKSVLTE